MISRRRNSRLTLSFPWVYTPRRLVSLNNCIGSWRSWNALLVAVALLVPGLSWAEGSKVACLGLTLPSSAKKLGSDPKECRFEANMNWDETVKFFDRGLPSAQTRWYREVNIPAAKYRHVESTNPKTAWEGLNIYQLGGDASGDTKLYVIPRVDETKQKKSVSGDARKKNETSREEKSKEAKSKDKKKVK